MMTVVVHQIHRWSFLSLVLLSYSIIMVASTKDSSQHNTVHWTKTHDGLHNRLHIPLHRRQSSSHHRTLTVGSEHNQTFTGLDFNEVPLGVGIGTHYAELHFGIPPQKASVIVDTGSHLTALPCKNCDKCGTHTDPPYDLNLSTTVSYVDCQTFGHCRSCDGGPCYMSLSYSEGSMWRAVMVKDVCWLGSLTGSEHDAEIMNTYGIRFPIGCQVKETGLFITQKANGIMGLSDNDNTIIKYLANAGKISTPVFTMCFALDGGSMSIGGVDHSMHLEPPVFVPYVLGNGGWYRVHVSDILVGSVSLASGGGESSFHSLNRGKGTIVDSGTTDTFFSRSLAQKFKTEWENAVGKPYWDTESRIDKSVTYAELKNFPTLTIVIGNPAKGEKSVSLVIPPTQYFSKTEDGNFVGNFHFSEFSGGVIGASAMMNYNVIFNQEDKTVGFARSQCTTTSYSDTMASGVHAPSGVLRFFIMLVFGASVIGCLIMVVNFMMKRNDAGKSLTTIEGGKTRRWTSIDGEEDLERRRTEDDFSDGDDDSKPQEDLSTVSL